MASIRNCEVVVFWILLRSQITCISGRHTQRVSEEMYSIYRQLRTRTLVLSVYIRQDLLSLYCTHLMYLLNKC